MLVRLRDFARSHNRTPANRRTHMRLDELDGESGLADTCTSAKGLRTSGPVRPASDAGFGEWELRRAAGRASKRSQLDDTRTQRRRRQERRRHRRATQHRRAVSWMPGPSQIRDARG